ncbi:MAG: hypothetical protein ABGW69_03270 [Nanoarchaeota archaeon]
MMIFLVKEKINKNLDYIIIKNKQYHLIKKLKGCNYKIITYKEKIEIILNEELIEVSKINKAYYELLKSKSNGIYLYF